MRILSDTFFCLSILLLTSALPDCSWAQVLTVALNPLNVEIEAVNDEFSVDVTISDVVDLHGAATVVQFDPLILEAVSVVKGEFLGSGGQSTFFWSDFDNSEGRVQCDEAILGPHKVSGSGVLHRITFKALRLGETGLAFGTVDLRDLDNVTLPAKSTDGHVAIGSVYVDDEVSTTSPLPEEYFLVQNSPNPFNAQTTIRYGVPTASGVHLVVYNVMGQAVRVLADHHQEAGRHRVMWDGTDDLGRDVRSGTYVLKMRAGDFVDSCKMLLLK